MIDVAGLANPDLITEDDFEFRVGNDDSPAHWALVATAAQISVRTGEGKDGSDRITIIWPNKTIQNQWLQVIVKATVNTGLGSPDVHYWGNAIGESGNSAGNTFVNASDEIGARNHPHGRFNLAVMQDEYDFNRDAMVNATDELLARNHPTGRFNSLKLIMAPEAVGGAVYGARGASEAGVWTSIQSATSSSSPSMVSPSMVSPSMVSPSMVSPSMVSPSIVSPPIVSPSIVSPSIVSPSIVSPSIVSPSIVSPSIVSPSIVSPSIVSPPIVSPPIVSPPMVVRRW